MWATIKNALEVVLWYWIGRPTTKMEQRYKENAAKRGSRPLRKSVYF